ncbi:hypothetical protein QAD02_000683 [Eretmocerus hayati]|uniref:Uncharacterized protein n=1 Tax=Eretmocerus hayati TaxID=131215 RepID=A0ACC2NGE4_9HYME|nr:hypothetical protein QAD02_000683 [Eretmocerus hayati]
MEAYTENFFEILHEQGTLNVGQPQKNILIHSGLAHRDNLMEHANDFDKFIKRLQEEVRKAIYKRILEAHGITNATFAENPGEYFGNYYDDPKESFLDGREEQFEHLVEACYTQIGNKGNMRVYLDSLGVVGVRLTNAPCHFTSWPRER